MSFILAVFAVRKANYVVRTVIKKIENQYSLDVGIKQKNTLLQTSVYFIIDLNMKLFDLRDIYHILRVFFSFLWKPGWIKSYDNQTTGIQDIGMRILVGSILSKFAGTNLLQGHITNTAYSCNMSSHNLNVPIFLNIWWAT